MKALRPLALGCALAPLYIYAQPASADSLCGPEAQTQPLARLVQRIAQCQTHPDWLTHLGQRLNAEGRHTEAAEHLERALLLAPQHLGAALAYSIALAGSGDTASALNLLAQLTQRPDLPAPQRADLLAAQVRMAQGPATSATAPHGWQTRTTATLRVGHDNNLLGAPRLGSLTLNLPGGDVTLPLDDSNQPRPGSYQRTDLRTEATHTGPQGRRTDLALALQHRTSPSVPSANTTQTELLAETQPQLSGAWASTSFANLRTQSGTRYHSTGVGSGWAWGLDSAPGCQPRLGAEWQNRRLVSNPILSGRYGGLVASWGCSLPTARWADAGWAPLHWHVSARWGLDQPTQTTRPGGNQHTSALRATARWAQWQAEAELVHTQDHTGYSPLLSNGRVRHTTRALLRAEHHWPLPTWGTGVQATLGAEVYQQQSNLLLFKVNSASAYASLRKQW